jgi:hypothetical protein
MLLDHAPGVVGRCDSAPQAPLKEPIGCGGDVGHPSNINYMMDGVKVRLGLSTLPRGCGRHVGLRRTQVGLQSLLKPPLTSCADAKFDTESR